MYEFFINYIIFTFGALAFLMIGCYLAELDLKKTKRLKANEKI